MSFPASATHDARRSPGTAANCCGASCCASGNPTNP